VLVLGRYHEADASGTAGTSVSDDEQAEGQQKVLDNPSDWWDKSSDMEDDGEYVDPSEGQDLSDLCERACMCVVTCVNLSNKP